LSDLLELCLLLTGIYLLDCAVVVPRRAVGLVRFAGRWRVQRAFTPNAAWSHAALFSNPLPPLSPVLIAEPLPLVMGRDGISFDGVSNEGGFLRWDDARGIAVSGTRVEVAGRPIAVLATRRGATCLADALRQLPGLAPDARLRRLDTWLDARFDHQALGRRLATFRRETRLLAVVSNLLWGSLFIGMVALVRLPLVLLLLTALALVITAWMAVALMTELRLRNSAWLLPAWRPEPMKRILAALTPIGATRSVDLLARELFGDVDPLALGAAFLRPEALAAMARPRLVELRFSSPPVPAGGERDLAWWQTALLARVERLLGSRGIDARALLQAPPRDGPEVVAWCPSCLAQYTAQPTNCRNVGCAGITLTRY
jgi:hypothetical protein